MDQFLNELMASLRTDAMEHDSGDEACELRHLAQRGRSIPYVGAAIRLVREVRQLEPRSRRPTASRESVNREEIDENSHVSYRQVLWLDEGSAAIDHLGVRMPVIRRIEGA